MNITERQFGRIESACYALAKLTERNEVGTVLVNTIREILDEIDTIRGDLDGFDQMIAEKTDRKLAEIREYGREVLSSDSGTIPAIRMICEHFGLRDYEFARLIGSSPASLSRYLHGVSRESSVLMRLAEFFGDDGKAGA